MKRSIGMLVLVFGLFFACLEGRSENPFDLPQTLVMPNLVAQDKKEGGDKKKLPPPEKKKEVTPPLVVADTPPPEEPTDELAQLPRAPEMLGDSPSFYVVPLFIPGNRSFKIADNSSPRPQDRVFFSFNFYNDLYLSLNEKVKSPVGNVRLYRETFGLEKTFLEGAASVDVRLPLNTLDVRSTLGTLDQAHTGVGDLTLILKYAPLRDMVLDNWLTLGLAVTIPTGTDHLAGYPFPSNFEQVHDTIIQPFVGGLYNYGEFYFQGFSAFDIPTDRKDGTFLLNDIGVGYFLYRTANSSRIVTALAPALEAHVLTPLDHRQFGAGNLFTSMDVVNLGGVANMELCGRARLAVGAVAPVTGPRPFDIEGVIQLRYLY